LQCTTLCDKCVEVCPNRANFSYRVSPANLMVPLVSCQDGELIVAGQEPFSVKQDRQIIHVDDFCNECGNCATFCVHDGKPYSDKPRLFLKEGDFLLEDDNAFFIQGNAIRRQEGGQELRLLARDDQLIFEDAHLRVSLTSEFKISEMALKEAFEGVYSLKMAAEMALLLEGINASAAYLLA
jgi:putative selenate reductase